MNTKNRTNRTRSQNKQHQAIGRIIYDLARSASRISHLGIVARSTINPRSRFGAPSTKEQDDMKI